MGRWTQDFEDSSRLPEGFRRIGYDEQTTRYIYCDSHGSIYYGAPGHEYGRLTSATSASLETVRPQAFEDPSKASNPKVKVSTDTFHDILPSNLIASPSSSEEAASPRSHSHTAKRDGAETKSPGTQIMAAVRRVALPKKHRVVQSRSDSSAPNKKGCSHVQANLKLQNQESL